MNDFAEWLSSTSPSVFIQTHEVWAIPGLQSFHIIGIGIAVGSTLMMMLRLLGWAGMDQTLRQSQRRFGPWLAGALCLLLATGSLLIVGEPVRELVTFSFWLKMILVVFFSVMVFSFQLAVKKHEQYWEHLPAHRKAVGLAALLTFLVLGCIILLGRLIAYDQIWGRLSPVSKA